MVSPQWMFGGQFLPLLAVVFYAAIFTNSVNAWFLGLIYGVLWDALMGFRLGITSTCLLATVGLVFTQPLSKLRQNPLLQLLICVAAITLFQVSHYLLAFCLERQRFIISSQLLWNIAASSLLNSVFCLVLFPILDLALTMLGHKHPRDISYHV